MSSDDKKDLTRIEDLGEFIHELNSEEEIPSWQEDSSDDSAFPKTPDSFEGSSETQVPEPVFEPQEEINSEFTSEFTTEYNSEFDSSSPFGSEENAVDFESVDEEDKSIFSDENIDSPTLPPLPETTIPTASSEVDLDSSNQNVNGQLEFSDTKADDNPTPELEIENNKTPLPTTDSSSDVDNMEYLVPESFEEVKTFSESSHFSDVASEGGPFFSVLVKDIRFFEDVEDIIRLLNEFDLIVDSEEQTRQRLMRGVLLIPRISEFTAISLAHYLRRLDLEILVGLSDDIHPPKNQPAQETGLISKRSLYQNQSHYFKLDKSDLQLSDILICATASLEGHQIVRYMGIASEHKLIESQALEDENSAQLPEYYQELAQKLKAHALKNNSNAVVGLNYQLTPLPGDLNSGEHRYRLTCTGNLVWVIKR